MKAVVLDRRRSRDEIAWIRRGRSGRVIPRRMHARAWGFYDNRGE